MMFDGSVDIVDIDGGQVEIISQNRKPMRCYEDIEIGKTISGWRWGLCLVKYSRRWEV